MPLREDFSSELLISGIGSPSIFVKVKAWRFSSLNSGNLYHTSSTGIELYHVWYNRFYHECAVVKPYYPVRHVMSYLYDVIDLRLLPGYYSVSNRPGDRTCNFSDFCYGGGQLFGHTIAC